MDVVIEGLEDLRLIGQGGFGTVYRAWQTDFGRDVAVKVLPAATIDDRALARFERERHALGRLSGHPHIIAVHDHGRLADGSPYLVMEFASGGSLGDAVATAGPMPWPAVVGYGVQICTALQAAHDAGVLHRDVKPDNILLTAGGVPKLADFGIARLSDHSRTDTESVTASLLHAAPELVQGVDPSVATDLYALGSTLFTLAAGGPPFPPAADGTMPGLLGRIAMQPPPDLRRIGVPHDVAAAIERLLAKQPADRPASAAEAADLLRAARDATAPTATHAAAAPTDLLPRTAAAATATPSTALLGPPTAPLPPTTPPPHRPRRARTAVAAVAIAMAGLLGGLALAGVVGGSGAGGAVADAVAPSPTEAADGLGEALQPVDVRASDQAPDGVDAGGVQTTFAGGNVADGDPTTAWRIEGDGVGATLTFRFEGPVRIDGIRAVTGYDKADPADGRDRWQENRRVLQLRLTADDGRTVEVDLADTRGVQEVAGIDLGPTTTVVAEVVRSTGHGGRDFAALSELVFAGR